MARAAARNRSIQLPTSSGRVFSAGRLTMRRELTSAMCSISMRPLARSVAPVCEMSPRDLVIFGGDPQMAPAARVFVRRPIRRRRDRHMAMPDIEVERRIDLGVIEFYQ